MRSWNGYRSITVRLLLGAIAQVMDRDAQNSADHGQVADPLQRAFPDADQQRNGRVLGKASVAFGMFDVVQHVHDMGAADARWIVNTGVGMRGVFPELRGALFA